MSSGDGKDAGGTAAGGGDGAAAAAAGGGLTKAKSKTSSEAKSGGSSTFLTSVSFSGGAAGDDFRKEIQMRAEELKAAKMSQVMKSFSRMNESVEGLGVNVKKLLRKQEKDFLAAYRAHMYKVQKELQDLRAKVDESELALKKNDKIQQLEKERDWFRREALRLDTFSTTMRKDLDYMKKKLESIEVDRHWLEQQLKAAKKQNKLLRAELDIRLAGPEDDEFEGFEGEDTLDEDHVAMEIAEIKAPGSRGTFARRAHSAGGDGRQQGGKIANVLGQSLSQVEVGYGSRGVSTTMPALGGASARGRKEKILLNTNPEVIKLRKELFACRQELSKMRAKAVESRSERGEMEELFLQCVEEVKRSIQRRRKGRTGSQHHSEEKRKTPLDVTTDDFTAKDKVVLVQKLMSNDTVLSCVYENIFPEQEPNAGGETSLVSITSGAGGASPALAGAGFSAFRAGEASVRGNTMGNSSDPFNRIGGKHSPYSSSSRVRVAVPTSAGLDLGRSSGYGKMRLDPATETFLQQATS